MSKVSYAYATARVKVRQSRLLDDEDYEKLLKMEVPQITRFLQDTQYEEEIDELGSRYDGATLLEYGLSLNLSNDFTSLRSMATGDLKQDLEAYLRRYDVRNIKTLIRGKSYGAESDEVRENLVPAGKLSQERLYELEGMETRDLLDELLATEYGPALDELAETYEETGEFSARDVSLAENEMEKIYYNGLLDRLGPKPTPFSRVVRSEIDFVNVLMLLRLSADPLSRDVAEDRLRRLLLDGGMDVGEDLLDRLLEAPDLETMLNALRKEGPWDIPEELGTVSDVEAFLEDEMVEEARSMAHQSPLSIAPIVSYILAKQREVDRVRAIARGKEAGMSEDEIREDLL